MKRRCLQIWLRNDFNECACTNTAVSSKNSTSEYDPISLGNFPSLNSSSSKPSFWGSGPLCRRIKLSWTKYGSHKWQVLIHMPNTRWNVSSILLYVTLFIIITTHEHACLYRSYFPLYRDIDFCPKHTMAAQIMFILRSRWIMKLMESRDKRCVDLTRLS